jgi:hypothetical protein
MVGEMVDPFYLTEGSYEVKLLALKSGASREGNFILYCAPQAPHFRRVELHFLEFPFDLDKSRSPFSQIP